MQILDSTRIFGVYLPHRLNAFNYSFSLHQIDVRGIEFMCADIRGGLWYIKVGFVFNECVRKGVRGCDDNECGKIEENNIGMADNLIPLALRGVRGGVEVVVPHVMYV